MPALWKLLAKSEADASKIFAVFRQETKNDENVAGVLPNTRQLGATIRVP